MPRKKNENMTRINVYMPKEMHHYYKEKSKRTGIPMTTLILLGLTTVIQQEQAMHDMPKLLQAYEELRENGVNNG